MVRTLLANREDQYADYHPEVFRESLAARFDIKAEQPLKGGKRHIYFAEASPSRPALSTSRLPADVRPAAGLTRLRRIRNLGPRNLDPHTRARPVPARSRR